MRSKLSAARTRSAAFDSRRDGPGAGRAASPRRGGLALAYYVQAYVHFRAAEMHEMEQAARRALAHADRSARLRGNGRSHTRSVGRGRRSDSGSGGDTRVRAARRGRGSRAPGGPLFARDPARDARQDRRCSGSSRPCAGVGTGTDAWAVSDDGSCARPREWNCPQATSLPRSGSWRMRWSLPELGASRHHLSNRRAPLARCLAA